MVETLQDKLKKINVNLEVKDGITTISWGSRKWKMTEISYD